MHLLIPLLLFLSSLIYLHLYNESSDDSPLLRHLHRLLRLYVFLFGIALIFIIIYKLIIYFSNLQPLYLS